MRRTVPLVITFCVGVFMILSFFFNKGTGVNDAASRVKDWCLIIGGFTVVLGTGNIIRVSLHKAKKHEDRPYKIVLLIALFITMFLGLFWGTGAKTSDTFLVQEGGWNPFYWIFQNIQRPLSATMFSLLVFYITSAAYRAFRVRSVEAGILLATGVVVMIGQIPWSTEIGFDTLMVWIMSVPNAAAKRAILMGAAMGIAAMSLRVILGIERSYLGGS